MSINSFTQGGFTGSKKQSISGTQELPANDMLMEYYVMAGGGGGGNNRAHSGWGNHTGGKEELVDFLWMPMFRYSTKELLMQFLLVEAVEPSQMEQTQLLFIMAELSQLSEVVEEEMIC